MVFCGPFKARSPSFYFGIVYALHLACSGTCHGHGSYPDDWKNDDMSWQDFDKDGKTNNTSILCGSVSLGIKSIKCNPNGLIAILKVGAKLESRGEDVDNDKIMKILLDNCNGREHCIDDATVAIEKQCQKEGHASEHAEIHVEYMCIGDSDILDICDYSLPIETHMKDMLYVISPGNGSSNWNCNFSLSSNGKRQWSAFVFHLGPDTFWDVYYQTEPALGTEYPVDVEVDFPGTLTYESISAQNISFVLSGQLDFFMVIKDAKRIDFEVIVPASGHPTWQPPPPPTHHPSIPSQTSTVQHAGVPPPQDRPPKKRPRDGPRKKDMYIGVGAGIGGLLILLVIVAVVCIILRKRRRMEPSTETTGEQYSQPMKKRKKRDNKSHETGGNHAHKGRGHQSNQSTTSINSDAPPPVPLFLGMEKSNGNEGAMYVNMTPTAPIGNSKVATGKRKHKTPRGKRERKEENHEQSEHDSNVKSSDRQKEEQDGAKSDYEYSYADRYRPTEIMKKVMKNPPKSTSSEKSYSASAAGSNFTYDYADPVHDV